MKKSDCQYNISVVIPAYNVNKYIHEAIESALNQSAVNVEVIVVDDGSRAKVEDELPKCMLEKIKLIRIKNSGVSVARNIGICAATADTICLLDGDDYLHPDHCRLALGKIRESGGRVIYVPKGFLVGVVNSKTGKLPGGKSPASRMASPNGISATVDLGQFIRGEQPIAGCCVFPQSIIKEIGGYKADLRSCEDFHLHARLIMNQYFYIYADSPTYYYRRHEDSLTVKAGSELYKNRIHALEDLIDRSLSEEHTKVLAMELKVTSNELTMKKFKEKIKLRDYGSAVRHLFLVDTGLINQVNKRIKWSIIKFISKPMLFLFR